jgi:hypothetical protein
MAPISASIWLRVSERTDFPRAAGRRLAAGARPGLTAHISVHRRICLITRTDEFEGSGDRRVVTGVRSGNGTVKAFCRSNDWAGPTAQRLLVTELNYLGIAPQLRFQRNIGGIHSLKSAPLFRRSNLSAQLGNGGP